MITIESAIRSAAPAASGDEPHEESNVSIAEGDHDDAEPVDPNAGDEHADDDHAEGDAPADDEAEPEPDDEPHADDAGSGDEDDGFGDGIHGEKPLAMAAAGSLEAPPREASCCRLLSENSTEFSFR